MTNAKTNMIIGLLTLCSFTSFFCIHQSTPQKSDMNKIGPNTSYQLSKLFSVPPDVVYQAFIDEEMLKKIWGVSEIKIDARTNGKARAKLQIDDENWDFTITYKEVIPNKKLRWIVNFDRFPNKETRATLLFIKKVNGTELIFRQQNFENAQERDDNRQANEEALKTLKSLLEQ